MAQRLFKTNPEQDEGKRLEIAQDLGMDPNQVKFWFQHRRNQKKSKEDNEMMEKETDGEFKEKLKGLMKMCQACDEGSRPPSSNSAAAAAGDNSFEQLMNDNQPLKSESDDDELSCLLRYMENHPLSEQISLQSFLNPTRTERRDSALNLNHNLTLGNSSVYSSSWSKGETSLTPTERERMMESERALMVKVAKAAMEELVVLVSTNEPLWESLNNSPNSAPRLVLIPQIYDILSHRVPSSVYDNNQHHFNNSTTMRVESSRDSRIVKLQASELVDAILNTTCWTNMFPTMIPKALTLQVLKKGTEGNQHGALQLIYEEMHLLSPLLPPREFFLLRFCQQLESNVWFIADVSYNHAKEEKPADQFRAWKRPSGCKIEALPDGTSRVTWVENVLVDDLSQTHPLFRDLLVKGGSTAYGAEKWLMEIQRTSERFASFTSNDYSNYEIEGVMITFPGERRNLMRVCQRMVREFCGILKHSSKKEYNRNTSELVRDNGIRFSICDKTDEEEEAHHNTNSNDSNAVLASSIWLPFTSQHVFSFFSDPKNRSQWDFICSRNRVEVVARFSTGTHPGNYISIMQLVKPGANKVAMIIIQESFTSSCGSYIMYSPISEEDFYTAIHGDREASISVPLLLYGLTIADDEDYNDDDGGDNNSVIGSSLLTLTLQVPIQKGQAAAGGGAFSMEPSEASATEIIAKIIEKIKVALDCPESESDEEDDSDGNN
ncbi:hypothetical protein PIB30_079766 [Stylosanthes scabra]|uniref:Uncharacterized protein n=1 Tax=Stylosanthes scabra TaxID=79078 RepID=A0ABU6YRT6_9FABA|nr:hypothetical protein [Stylosanthes scabra]